MKSFTYSTPYSLPIAKKAEILRVMFSSPGENYPLMEVLSAELTGNINYPEGGSVIEGTPGFSKKKFIKGKFSILDKTATLERMRDNP